MCEVMSKQIDLNKFNSDYERFQYIERRVLDHRYSGTPREYEAFHFLIGYIKEQHEYYHKMFAVLDEEKQMLFVQIAEKEREIEWLRQDRESLQGRIAVWKGYDA